MEDKTPSILIVLAGLAVAFFLWKRSKDKPAFGDGTGPTFGDGAARSTATDPPDDTPTRGAKPGFGGGTSKAAGGGGGVGKVPTTRATGPVNAPVTRGGPPPKATGSATIPSGPAVPTQSVYVKPGAPSITDSTLLKARIAGRTSAAHL